MEEKKKEEPETKQSKREWAEALIEKGDVRSYWEIMADLELSLWTKKMKD